LGRITGREPFVTLDGVRMSRHRMFFSPAKSERELGVRARPYTEGLEDAVRWFYDAGYLGARAMSPSVGGDALTTGATHWLR